MLTLRSLTRAFYLLMKVMTELQPVSGLEISPCLCGLFDLSGNDFLKCNHSGNTYRLSTAQVSRMSLIFFLKRCYEAQWRCCHDWNAHSTYQSINLELSKEVELRLAFSSLAESFDTHSSVSQVRQANELCKLVSKMSLGKWGNNELTVETNNPLNKERT